MRLALLLLAIAAIVMANGHRDDDDNYGRHRKDDDDYGHRDDDDDRYGHRDDDDYALKLLKQVDHNVYAIKTVVGDIDETTHEIQQTLKDVETTVDNIDTNVSAILADVVAIEAIIPVVNTIASNVETILDDVTAIETTVNAIETTVDTIQKDVETVQTTVTDIDNVVTQTETIVKRIDTDVDIIETDQNKYFIYLGLSLSPIPQVLCLPKSITQLDVNVEQLEMEVKFIVESMKNAGELPEKAERKIAKELGDAHDLLANMKYSSACKCLVRAYGVATKYQKDQHRDDDDYHKRDDDDDYHKRDDDDDHKKH